MGRNKERTAGLTATEAGAESDGFPYLKVVKGSDEDVRFVVRAERVTLGRRRADLTLHDLEVSGTHAEIVRSGADHLLRDAGSTNGTFLNGQAITEALLRPGDEIGIGQTLLRWEVPGAVAPASPAPGSLSPSSDLAVESLFSSPTGASSGQPTSTPSCSLGLYDTIAIDRASLILSDGPGLEGLDPEGTALLDLSSRGVSLALPHQCLVQLEFIAGTEKGRTVALNTGNIVIGRFGTDVVLNDGDVSRRHLALDVYGRDHIFMRDLGSTNGCYRNGERVQFTKLQSGDTLVVGRSVIQLVVKERL